MGKIVPRDQKTVENQGFSAFRSSGSAHHAIVDLTHHPRSGIALQGHKLHPCSEPRTTIQQPGIARFENGEGPGLSTGTLPSFVVGYSLAIESGQLVPFALAVGVDREGTRE